MEFRVLGSLEAAHAQTLLPLGGPRHRALLAMLLIHAGRQVSTAGLIDALWGADPPASAPALVHVRISELRHALRAGRQDRWAGIRTTGSGYLLQLDPDELDATRFERLINQGGTALRGGDTGSAATVLREALALWRGPPLQEIADRPYAQVEIARLDSLRLHALEDRLETDLALGRHEAAVVDLETLVTVHPLRERFWAQLMRAHYRTGRQGDALQAYERVRVLLLDQLGVDPGPDLQALHTAVLRQDPGLSSGPAVLGLGRRIPTREPIRQSLPSPLTPFIGRDWELAALQTLLERNRLVTITGVGGTGKSRLAVQAASACQAEFPDGAWLVELAPLTQSGLVIKAVAQALGVPEQPGRSLATLVFERVNEARVLLIMDNCDHLIEEAAGVAEQLLQSCSRLRILATSRERLNVPGEVLRPITGLPPPELRDDRAGSVGCYDAARLFIARAAAARPGFALCDNNAPVIAHICRRLDGLPLAIELTAARVNALGVEDIAALLEDRCRMLSSSSRTSLPRHQTLRAALDWSYDLLKPAERRLFDRIAVFVGGFTSAAAAAVSGQAAFGAGEDTTIELISHLVDKSLLSSDSTGAPSHRYRPLETLRDYGLERLDERGESAITRDAHAAYFLTLAELAGQGLRGPDQPVWLERLEAERGNLSAALAWSIERDDVTTAMRLAASIYQWWDLHGHYREGRGWLARILAVEGSAPPGARARTLLAAATLAIIQGDLEYGTNACEQAAQACREVGDVAGLAHALQYLGLVGIFADDLDEAARMLAESLTFARSAADRWVQGWSTVFLATHALARADYTMAAHATEGYETTLGLGGDPECLAWILLIRGIANWYAGFPADASAPLQESLRAFQRLGGLWGLSFGLFIAGSCAASRGNPQRLALLMGASEALRELVGAAQFPFYRRWLDTAVENASRTIGSDLFDHEWQTGQAWPLNHAVNEALREFTLIVATESVRPAERGVVGAGNA